MKVELLSLITTCSLFWTSQCRRPFVFNFKNAECSANPKFIDSFGCSVGKSNSSSRSTISIELALAEDITRMTFDVLITLPQAIQSVVLINNTHLSGCDFLENKSSLHLFQIVRKELQKYSNFPNKCPISKGTKLQVHELEIDPEIFPKYMPETKFCANIRIYQNGEGFFNTTVNGACESTRSFFRGRG